MPLIYPIVRAPEEEFDAWAAVPTDPQDPSCGTRDATKMELLQRGVRVLDRPGDGYVYVQTDIVDTTPDNPKWQAFEDATGEIFEVISHGYLEQRYGLHPNPRRNTVPEGHRDRIRQSCTTRTVYRYTDAGQRLALDVMEALTGEHRRPRSAAEGKEAEAAARERWQRAVREAGEYGMPEIERVRVRYREVNTEGRDVWEGELKPLVRWSGEPEGWRPDQRQAPSSQEPEPDTMLQATHEEPEIFGPETHREAALASLQNAKELAAEATLLLEHGHLARAAALAIIGLEEVSKGWIFTLSALGMIRSQDAERLSRHHLAKQVLLDAIGDVADMMEDYRSSVEKVAGVRPSFLSDEYLYRMLDHLRFFAHGLLDDAKIGKQWASELVRDRKGMMEALNVRPARRAWLLKDQLKQRALYVDVGESGQVSTPAAIGAMSAQKAVGEFESALNHAASMQEILSNDEAWAAFCQRAP